MKEFPINTNFQSKIQNGKFKQGFSLIEIVLFLFLVIALVSILFATSGTYFRSRSSSLQSIATKIASRQIETLRNTTYASLPSSGTFSDSDLSKLPGSTAAQTITNYGSNSTIKQVSITISWTENNSPREIKMETLISQFGL